jgi:hypothetical protein
MPHLSHITLPKRAVEIVHRLGALVVEEVVDAVLHLLLGRIELRRLVSIGPVRMSSAR